MSDCRHHRVAAALLVRDGRVLLCHRHPGRCWYPNVWDLPGGHIEGGESPEDAVRREVLEELGIDLHLAEAESHSIDALSPDLTLHTWVVTEWAGEVANLAPVEHDDIGWFGRDQLEGLALAHPTLRDLLAAAIDSI